MYEINLSVFINFFISKIMNQYSASIFQHVLVLDKVVSYPTIRSTKKSEDKII